MIEPGMQIDEFEIIRKIGEGGMGEVWLARETFMDLKVAIKILPHNLDDNERALERFRREIKLQAKLNHPSIVKVLKAGYANDHHYFTMDYVNGHTLSHYLNKGRLQERDCWKIALKIAKALRYAWKEFEMVHRDIKPENIYLRDDGSAVLLDFGSARQAVGGETLHAFRSSGHSFFVEINGDGSFRYEVPILDDYGSGQ